ncbi:unnamed protein product [Linum trigynum]|uniref:Uncharacterized protein n=1 Tax=Linum trigynum TaxID=586398 RepID=A0AAV2DB97_9ROSI
MTSSMIFCCSALMGNNNVPRQPRRHWWWRLRLKNDLMRLMMVVSIHACLQFDSFASSLPLRPSCLATKSLWPISMLHRKQRT